MTPSLTAMDVGFASLQLAVFCVDCERISDNNTPSCLACGSRALLNLSRILGGSMRGQQTARLIADAELDRMVRSLLHTVSPVPVVSGEEGEVELPAAASPFMRHHLRLRGRAPLPLPSWRQEINPAEIDLEPGISILAEKAQALTGATGAAIALRNGEEMICRARVGRTAPDLGVRLHNDTSFSAECARTGEVLLCHDTESSARVDWFTCRRLGVRSILAAPLRHFRRTLGVFEVLSSSPYAFDQQDVATMQFLSGMMVATMSRLAQISSQFPVPSSQSEPGGRSQVAGRSEAGLAAAEGESLP